MKSSPATGTSLVTQCTVGRIVALENYLLNDSAFRSSIYDHREVQCIADRFGLSPGCVRSELKRLGYQLVNNGHGRMVWKNKEGARINYSKRIASLEEYISKCEARQLRFYDKSELRRIANRIGVDCEIVRATLRRKGYKLTTNVHSIRVWIKETSRVP